MKTERQQRAEMRKTPAGQLLDRIGLDYYDTESTARRVAEHAAKELALATVRKMVPIALRAAAKMQGKEHADKLEAEAAKIRAELHNGQGSERIINRILGFLHDRDIHDSYSHSHHGGK